MNQYHHIAHAHHVAPIIHQGYTFMELLISNIFTATVAGGLGWYMRGRGLQGIANDINNIKHDIETLKQKTSTPAA